MNIPDKLYDLEQRYNALYASLKTWHSEQLGAGAWNAQATWTDFSDANWPHLDFTVPQTGAIKVTIGAAIWLTSLSSVAVIGFRISGTDTVGYDLRRSVGVYQTTGGSLGGVRASTARVITGLTAGASDTLTVGWYRGNDTADDAGDGQVIIEPAWA